MQGHKAMLAIASLLFDMWDSQYHHVMMRHWDFQIPFYVISMPLFIILFTECQRIIGNVPLTREFIQKLAPFSNQYIIPRNQEIMKSYGLVLFNSKDRIGAVAEAEAFEQV